MNPAFSAGSRFNTFYDLKKDIPEIAVDHFANFLWATTSCTKSKKESQVELFRTYCAVCHMVPAIDALPKVFLKDRVLPAMAARMGIRNSANDPFKGLPMKARAPVLKTIIYLTEPI